MLAASSGAALAQQFEKVENIPKQEIPAGRFVGIAYGIIWLAMLTYVLFVAAGPQAREPGDRGPEAQAGSAAGRAG